jgi:hypothetical protein
MLGRYAGGSISAQGDANTQTATGHALRLMSAKADAPHVATGPVAPNPAIRVPPAVPTQTIQLGVRD